MNKTIVNRILNETNYILETKKTIREIANVYNVSKSTVHKDLSVGLYNININLYNRVQQILQEHIEIRHIKGGESTKRKYLAKREINSEKIGNIC